MRPGSVLCGLAATAVVLAACGGDAPTTEPGAFERVVAASEAGRWRSTGDDAIEVWVCHVHPGAQAPLYGGLPMRVPLAPSTLASMFQQRVSRYFHVVSHGAYDPLFVAGGEITMGIADDEHDCVDGAIAGAADTTRAVIAVADAEHAPGEPGGMGSGGDPAAPEGPVASTRRYAYVGAADFDRGTWGDDPPMDLVEHELGHILGWVHSGLSPEGAYLSALDLMSNSAAPRDAMPARRDGPDVLAIHRVMAGWLPSTDVTVAGPDGVTLVLAPSTGQEGERLLVLPVDTSTFLTVELLVAEGYDDHLPTDGIAVHRVTVTGDTITTIDAVHAAAPFTELLSAGDQRVGDGWRLTVDVGGRVTARPTP